MSDVEDIKSNKKTRTRIRRKVKFEKEVFSKEEAQKILDKDSEKKYKQKPPKKRKKGQEEVINKTESGPKKKKNDSDDLNNLENEKPKKKKKKSKVEPNLEEISSKDDQDLETDDLNQADSPEESKKTESIRSRKRKKYQLLLEEKKLKSELNLQQKCLNYLSQWKHSKDTWKFEKLKQVWIQQNMFNQVKIPDEAWEIVVDYFNNSKGKIKSTVIAGALKIIEENKNVEENEDNDDDSEVMYKRARFIIQNIQE
ncbi:cholesin [Onthophagus taurus]|uniref:cholesin n=1 Tax=Onthophagus taurus TaxID=166361 RepID=UPI000C203DB7|nr:uncharacterized protein C7orf50 homolog [Onthophagus taurus]